MTVWQRRNSICVDLRGGRPIGWVVSLKLKLEALTGAMPFGTGTLLPSPLPRTQKGAWCLLRKYGVAGATM